MPTRTPAKWKSVKVLSDARNILPDDMGLFLQQDNVNDFKSMCMDIWDRCLSNKVWVNMSTHDPVKICQMLWHSEFCIALKRTKHVFIMYSIVAQVAQSRHQLIEYLTWKDGHNRRLFTIFGKLRSYQEKSSFKWNCRISGGHICWRETIQYRFMSLLCFGPVNLQLSKTRLSATQYFHYH